MNDGNMTKISKTGLVDTKTKEDKDQKLETKTETKIRLVTF